MPSAALTRWQTDRMSRLGHVDAHCATLFAASGPTAPSPLAEDSLQGYVVLLSGHFQGFCRDLYTESAQACANAAPAGLRAAVQRQFTSELKLNAGNPTLENIQTDFKRFGFLLDIAAAHPANTRRITHLAQLRSWRNAVAHQMPAPAPSGTPAALKLSDVQTWRASCDGLATSLDGIMFSELGMIVGVAPW